MSLRAALPFAILAVTALAALAAGPAHAAEPAAGRGAPAAAAAGGGDAKISGPLDGMVFVGTMHVDAYDAPFDDVLTFADGAFISAECQRVCDFGTSPYYTRQEGEAVVFVSDTRCSEAPHSVRWEGRIVGDRIEGTVRWRTERFYWTVERRGTFAGTLTQADDRQAANVLD